MGTRIGLRHAVGDVYHEDRILMNMELRDRSPVRVFLDPFGSDKLQPNPHLSSMDLLERIRERGVLRVGFDDEALRLHFTTPSSSLSAMISILPIGWQWTWVYHWN